MGQRALLLIGTVPPPIGGVTVHVARLCAHLRRDNVPHVLFDYRRHRVARLIRLFLACHHIHLHVSNAYVRICIALGAKLCMKKLILTVHYDLGRNDRIENVLDELAIRIAYIPVVVNGKSFRRAQKLNHRARLITPFVPPLHTEQLSVEQQSAMRRRRESSLVFCTNASGLVYDEKGCDKYGIMQLVRVFSSLTDKSLVISDPSGAYEQEFARLELALPAHILLFSNQHDFFEVLKRCDFFIRNTSTDGDSLSVREAFCLRKTVLATDVVERPEGTLTYPRHAEAALLERIASCTRESNPVKLDNQEEINGYHELLALYAQAAV